MGKEDGDSRFRALGDLGRRAARFADRVTTPEKDLARRIGEFTMTRPAFLFGGVTLISLLNSADFVYRMYSDLFNLFFKHPDIITNGAKIVAEIQNQPSTEALRNMVVNHGAKIDLHFERNKLPLNADGTSPKLKVRTINIGDSNTYTQGIKNDGVNNNPDPQNQPNSFLQVAKLFVDPVLDSIDDVDAWESYSFAVPGAPSGDGYPTERRKYGIQGGEQFSNPEMQKLLYSGLASEEERKAEENTLNVLEINATGDDWRLLVQNALEMASFFTSLEHIEQATQKDIDRFKELLAESQKVSIQYGTHIAQILYHVEQINVLRRKKHLLEIKTVVTYPFSLGGAPAIPFSTLAGDTQELLNNKSIKKTNPDPNDNRYYIDLSNVPYGKDIAYLVTVNIYKQLSYWMNQIQLLFPPVDPEHPNLIPLEWLGLEKIKGFFNVDGHPSASGTDMQAILLLYLFLSLKSGEIKTVDKIITIPPNLADIPERIQAA